MSRKHPIGSVELADLAVSMSDFSDLISELRKRAFSEHVSLTSLCMAQAQAMVLAGDLATLLQTLTSEIRQHTVRKESKP